MRVVLEVTMPLGEWQTLTEQIKEAGISGHWPARDFVNEINSVIKKVTQTFEPDPEEEKP